MTYPYSVDCYCEGAPAPYVRNPCRTAKEARRLASKAETSARNVGARVTVRVTHDGAEERDWRNWDEEGNPAPAGDLDYLARVRAEERAYKASPFYPRWAPICGGGRACAMWAKHIRDGDMTDE